VDNKGADVYRLDEEIEGQTEREMLKVRLIESLKGAEGTAVQPS
jgi:hypothetical protein